MYDLIIIGSGPAGLGAALYGKRAGFSTLVIERNPMSGGQILNTYEVDNYLGIPGINGFDLGQQFRAHADRMGAEFLTAQVNGISLDGKIKRVDTDQGVKEAKAVILAPGATHRLLGVPGEQELTGMGVSYCATCDGAFFKGRDVAVAGGGDVAVEDAIFLARGCRKVWLVHRRDELRAARSLQEALFSMPNVEILWDSQILAVNGADAVEGITVRNKLSGEERELPLQGVFIAVGIRPETEMFRGLVECDENGYILAGEDCRTSVPGVFAAGDARKKQLRQVITAVADGANAVTSAENYFLSLA